MGLVLVLAIIIVAAVSSRASMQLDGRDAQMMRGAPAPENRPSVAAGQR